MTVSILKEKELCCCCDNEIPEEDKDLDGYCYECHSASHTYCCSCEAWHHTDWSEPECDHIFWNEEDSCWDGAGYEENHFTLDKDLFYAFLNEINEKGVYFCKIKYPRKWFFDGLIKSIQSIDKEEIYICYRDGEINGSSFKGVDRVFVHQDIILEDHEYVVKWLHSLNPKSTVANQLVINLIKEWQRLAPSHIIEDLVFSEPFQLQFIHPVERRLTYLFTGNGFLTASSKPE
jgi:hypothetical protein